MDRTIDDADESICSVCESMLCDGRCESSPVSQLVKAGLGGAGLVLFLVLVRWLIT